LESSEKGDLIGEKSYFVALKMQFDELTEMKQRIRNRCNLIVIETYLLKLVELTDPGGDFREFVGGHKEMSEVLKT